MSAQREVGEDAHRLRQDDVDKRPEEKTLALCMPNEPWDINLTFFQSGNGQQTPHTEQGTAGAVTVIQREPSNATDSNNTTATAVHFQ